LLAGKASDPRRRRRVQPAHGGGVGAFDRGFDMDGFEAGFPFFAGDAGGSARPGDQAVDGGRKAASAVEPRGFLDQPGQGVRAGFR
jgi:hypothetical protein